MRDSVITIYSYKMASRFRCLLTVLLIFAFAICSYILYVRPGQQPFSREPVVHVASSDYVCSKPTKEWPNPSQCVLKPTTDCKHYTSKTQRNWLRSVRSDKTSFTEEMVGNVKFLLLFLGHGRSGGSITGQLLNSHPNMLVANQFMLFHEMIYNPEYFETKSDVVRILAQASLNPDPILRKLLLKTSKGYQIVVKDVHVNVSDQTGLDSRPPITVVGDKGAGKTVDLHIRDPVKFSNLFQRLRTTVGIPFKFMEVIRNPFDIIATDVIYKIGGAKERRKTVKSELKISGKEKNKTIACSISRYFENAFAMVKMVPELEMDVLQVHLTDLVTNPRRELQRMCDFLEVECMEEFLVNCENTLFKELSKSRTSIDWTDEQKRTIENHLKNIPFLRRYSFISDDQ